MLVVDASAAVHLVLRDAGERLAPHEAIAPALLRSEATSALRQLAWRGDLDDAEAEAALERIVEAPIALEPPGSLEHASYRIAVRLGWAARTTPSTSRWQRETAVRCSQPTRGWPAGRGRSSTSPRSSRSDTWRVPSTRA